MPDSIGNRPRGRTAFPKGTLCQRLVDALGAIYRDQQFADLLPRRGQQAADAMRSRINDPSRIADGLGGRRHRAGGGAAFDKPIARVVEAFGGYGFRRCTRFVTAA